MPLKPGDRLAGTLFLDVFDQEGNPLVEALPICEMDLDARTNRVTMEVSTDVKRL
jgi:hypothetical protein